jgi:enoyl-CoA hydratase
MNRTRLLTEQQGRVLVVQFTNPPRNFFDEQMAIELRDLVREIDKDSSLGAVVFTGKDVFVTHYYVPDLIRGSRSSPFQMSYRQARALVAYVGFAERTRLLEGILRRTPARDALTAAQIYRTFRRMNASDKVFIAAINGVALGMGAIIALACDLRLMADGEDAAFGLIEQGISILAGIGGTQRLARMVGSSRAAELLLEGRFVSPAEASAIGLVHRVVPREDLQADALALAQRLAGRSPVLNREIKRMIYDAAARPFAQATRMEFASAVATLSTPRATQDMETYVAELGKHDSPTDRQVLDAWEKMLDTGRSSAGEAHSGSDASVTRA